METRAGCQVLYVPIAEDRGEWGYCPYPSKFDPDLRDQLCIDPYAVRLDRVAQVVSELHVRWLMRATSREGNGVVERRSLRVWNDLIPHDRLAA
jgi:hypothetical protein